MNTLDLKGIERQTTNFKLDCLVLNISNIIFHNYKMVPVGDKVK